MPKPNHLPLELLKGKAKEAFPDAKLVFVINWNNDDENEPPTIETHVGVAGAVLLHTTLEGLDNAKDVDPANNALRPTKANQVLQMTAPDGAVLACVSFPKWRWAGVQITA